MRRACTVLSSVAYPTLQHFPTFSHKLQDFRKEVTEHKTCVLIFSTTFVWNISHSRHKWMRYDKKRILVSLYSILYSCPDLMELEFS